MEESPICRICKCALTVDIVNIGHKGLKRIISASKQREDGLFNDDDASTNLSLHVKCRALYINDACVAAAAKRKNPIPRPQPVFDFLKLCFFCAKDASEDFIMRQIKKPKFKRSIVAKVKKPETKETVLLASIKHDDEWSNEVRKRIHDVDLTALDARYHQSCYSKFTMTVRANGGRRGRPECPQISKQMEHIYEFLESNSEDSQFTIQDIKDSLKIELPSEKTIRRKLIERYGDKSEATENKDLSKKRKTSPPTREQLREDEKLGNQKVLADARAQGTRNATAEDLTELNKQALQVTLARIEANPQLYIGIPKNCYHLVNLLRKKTRVPTVHILMCLKKVKLDTHFEELADQFGILASQAKQIFATKVPLIAKALHSFITNLDSSTEAVQNNLPIPFRAEHQNAACIVDSLELKIQSTKDLNDKRNMRNKPMYNDLTLSENGNTVKYLIASSPDGFINYVSPGYGGRNSDEQLLQNTKYLDKLKRGSCIVVKKGFQNTERILSKRGLKIVRSGDLTQGPFTELSMKVKPILDMEDHVERMVQRVRGFTMVNERSVISADLVSVVDDAVVISCALINLQSFVIN